MSDKIGPVLLIDDEEIDQRQYQRILNKSGLVERLETFTYADDALAYLKANPGLDVDLILLDINMPRMNGFEFLDAAVSDLGDDFAKVVVVMLTTSLNLKDQQRAFEFNMVKDFINKPLTLDHVQKVAGLLDKARAPAQAGSSTSVE